VNFCVSIVDDHDSPLGAHVTDGKTLFEAVRKAWDWFQDPFWKGPKPTLDTIFKVTATARPGEVWRVRARRALETAPKPGQEPLFDKRPEAL
jgi:hypothetical protein